MTTLSTKIRQVKDDVGFSWDQEEMKELIEFLKKYKSKAEIIPAPKESNLLTYIGGISPHDDYMFAAPLYYPLHSLFQNKKEFIVIGLLHGSTRSECPELNKRNITVLDEYENWTGTFKNIEVSPLRDLIKLKCKNDWLQINSKALYHEHSIEALLPFIQYFNHDFKLTPIIVGNSDFEKLDEMSDSISDVIVE